MLFKNISIIDGDFKLRKNVYLRTEGEFITYIGDKEPEAIEGEQCFDGKMRLIMPAFYNTHCHVPMTLLRGYGEGLDLHRWLNEKVFPFEAKLRAEDVYWSTKLGAMELIASGCASISDMYFFIEDMAQSLYECGMKANICHGISSSDPDVRLAGLKGYKDTLALKKSVAEGRFAGKGAGTKATGGSGSASRIKADMGLHAEYTSNENLVREVADAALDEGLGVHVHISETLSEHEECKARHGGRTPVKYFEDSGLFRSRVLAAHCVYIEDEDAAIMKAHGAFMAHNPSSNLKLGSGIAPFKKRFNEGLNICLGTDGASSNNNLNMFEEMHMAAMVARGITRDANAVSAADMIRTATYMGALAQERTDCGRVAVGSRADFIVLDMDKPHLRPGFDVLADIVFSAQSSDICMNVIDGDIVYKDGEFMFIDKEKVYYEADRSLKRIVSEL